MQQSRGQELQTLQLQLEEMRELNAIMGQRIEEERLNSLRQVKRKEQEILALNHRIAELEARLYRTQDQLENMRGHQPLRPVRSTSIQCVLLEESLGAALRVFVERVRQQPLTQGVERELQRLGQSLSQLGLNQTWNLKMDQNSRWMSGQLKHEGLAMLGGSRIFSQYRSNLSTRKQPLETPLIIRRRSKSGRKPIFT